MCAIRRGRLCCSACPEHCKNRFAIAKKGFYRHHDGGSSMPWTGSNLINEVQYGSQCAFFGAFGAPEFAAH